MQENVMKKINDSVSSKQEVRFLVAMVRLQGISGTQKESRSRKTFSSGIEEGEKICHSRFKRKEKKFATIFCKPQSLLDKHA